MDTQPIPKRELARKFSSFREEFQRDMVNLITSYWDNMTKELIKPADMIVDQQNTLSARGEEHNLTLTSLKSENGSLQEKLSEMTGDQDYLFEMVKVLKAENKSLRSRLSKNYGSRTEDPDQDAEDVDADIQDELILDSDDDSDSDRDDVKQSFQTTSLTGMHKVRGNSVKKQKEITMEQQESVGENFSKTGNNKYKCKHCTHETSLKRSMKDHLKTRHDIIGKLKCKKCSYETFNKTNFKRHTRTVHEKIKDHICNVCERRYSDKANLKNHTVIAHNFGGDKLKCDKCSYETGLKQLLDQHIKSVHDKIRDHACKICGFTTSVASELNIHMKSKHLKIRDKICDECGYATTRSTYLNTHIKSMHLMQKEHICSKCGYAATQKHQLRMHQISAHNMGEKLRCDQCPFASANKYYIEKHRRTMHQVGNN